MFFRRKTPTAIVSAESRYIVEKSYTSLAKKGYEKNVIVQRCISLIAKSIASVPLVLYQGNIEVEGDHPLKILLKTPALSMNYHGFMEALVSYYLLSGNVYAAFHKKSSTFSFLRPDTVTLNVDEKDQVIAYKSNEQTYPGESILHIKTFHPRHQHYGLSPLETATYAIEAHNAIAQHNISLMRNGGRPSGALLTEHGSLTTTQREELRRELNTMYAGENNTGRILLLDGGFKWVEMGLSPKDMDFLEAKNRAATEIAVCFGVSPLLVGILEHASYSNYKEARMQFWEDTVLPLLSKIVNSLNSFLHRFFEDDVHFVYNTDDVLALTNQHDAMWRKLNECAFLTDNEKREAVGYSPISS